MTFPQWVPGQENPEVPVNEGFDVLTYASVYGRDPDATTGLTWGYLGGRWAGFPVTAGTLTLTDATINYVVVAVATGAITTSTTITNWDNGTDYVRVFKLTTAGGLVTAQEDHRAGSGGVFGSGGAGGFADPMTTDGDLIVRSAGVPDRLAAGADGQVLTVVAGEPAWATPASLTNPMTSVGDLIYGTTAGAPIRRAIGSTGQVLTVTGGVPTWATPAGGSVTGFTPALFTASPNNTVNAARLLVNTASANGDMILTPKGTGATQAQLADNGLNGGNKRGTRAVDFQRERNVNTEVASGADSFAANKWNTASGDSSAAFGFSNFSAGSFTFVCGNGNNVSGNGGFSSGLSNIVSGACGVTIGESNTAGTDNSFARGKQSTSRSMKMAESHSSGSLSVGAGDCQIRKNHIGAFTSDATFKALTVTYGSADGTNQFDIPTGYAFAFSALVVGKQVSSGNMKAWKMEGLARNIAGTVSIVGTPVYTVIGETDAAAWDVRFLADNANLCVAIEVKGAAAASVYWSADVRVAEVTA